MRKFLCVLAVLALMVFALLSCTEEKPLEEQGGETDNASQGVSLADIECASYEAYEQFRFAFDKSDTALVLSLPVTWTVQEADGDRYFLCENEKPFGSVSSIGPMFDMSKQETLSSAETVLENGISVTYTEHLLKMGSTQKYRRCFVFSYPTSEGEKQITVDFPYERADSASKEIIISGAALNSLIGPKNLNSVTLPEGKNSILFYGNSFIGSSQIINILNEMCHLGKKQLNVDFIFRSTDNAEADAREIKSKKYGAVFICGWYADGNIDGLEPIVDACVESGAVPVVFPAHNERQKTVAYGVEYFGDKVVLLNWKDEIDECIRNNLGEYADFCVDDVHQHSTPLAGYIGAHMVYRAIFGELPKRLQDGAISQSYVDSKLGDYVQKGFEDIIVFKDIYYFEGK